MELFTTDQLMRVETLLAQDECREALPVLEELAARANAYADEMCPASEQVQWFSFADQFERLTYIRVERDPRELRDVPAPFSRVFADLGYCQARLEDWEASVASFKQAVRWDPMDCASRINLAGALVQAGDLEECMRVTFSVFARASSSAHLARAFSDFADYFLGCEQYETAAACVKCGLRFGPDDERLARYAAELAQVHQCDPASQTDDLTESLLDAQGIPQGANVEVVISALLLADLASQSGDWQTAERMRAIAVDLVGERQAAALAALVADNENEEG